MDRETWWATVYRVAKSGHDWSHWAKQRKKRLLSEFVLYLWFSAIWRAWQPTPVFLPGESHGQRNLAGYNPWGRKESDTTEWLTHTARAHTHTGVAFVVVVIICIYPAWCLFSELPGSVVWCLILILILLLVFNNLGKFSVIIVSNMSSVPFSFRYSHYVYIIPL